MYAVNGDGTLRAHRLCNQRATYHPVHAEPLHSNDNILSAKDFFRKHNLKKHHVPPDGSCFLYIILATLGVTNKHLKRVLQATEVERCMADDLRQRLIPQFGRAIAQAPVYDGNKCIKLGKYGGDAHWQVLAPMLNISFVLWDRCLDAHDTKHIIINSDGRLRHKTAQEIDDVLNEEEHVVHAVWSTTIDDHFDHYS